MTFKDQPWANRFDQMGDLAEGHFEAYATDELKLGFVRYGLDRPPLRMSMLPTRLRYTPDYLMSGTFVEVQGFGRDQKFKLKLEKYNSLHYWNDLHPVWLYVWDSKNSRQTLIHLFEIDSLINNGDARLDFFPEGKAYFEIDGESIFAAGQQGFSEPALAA